MNLIESINAAQLRTDIPDFRPGDTVRVHAKVVEGTRERIQIFEGVVIARKNSGINETYTVRKISNGVGVERIFPVHTPRVEKIEVIRHGKVRRAKLYYLRALTGKKLVSLNVVVKIHHENRSVERFFCFLIIFKIEVRCKKMPRDEKGRINR